MEHYVLFTVVAVLAGLSWSMTGYLANWRKNHDSPEWKGFDYSKMGKDAVLGAVLGVSVVIIQPISEALTGTAIEIPLVTDFPSFIVGIFAMWGPVGIVDKFILGFVAKK